MKATPSAHVRSRYERAPSFAETFTGPGRRSLLPGGFGRSTFAIAPRVPMVMKGSGHWIFDEDGRRLIDLNNNFTALIHGHAHPEVTEAARQALADGASFGLPTAHELAHASTMLDRIRYMDQIRYCNSGSEAVMLAVRVARAVTGRDQVVFVRSAYHGTSDVALAPGGERSRRGVPEGVLRDTHDVGMNDLVGLRDVFAGHGRNISSLVLDPMPNRVGLVAATTEFLTEARRLCDEAGALLVADEVIALRQAYAGAVCAAGVVPDLLTVGKIIGGGLPIGAVLGREETMSRLDPFSPTGLEHGGTFSGNPVSMAAGAVGMRLFPRSEVDRLNGLGDLVRSSLAERLPVHGCEVRGSGSLLRVFPSEPGALGGKTFHTTLWWEAYERGLLLTQNGLACLSTPMDEDVAHDIVDRLADAVAVTARSAADRPDRTG
ncbi:aspartate aminotransferase family protein [Streptomyces phaeolivaceus]|nr:aminotransferase class III-fold pyridoxal phosphate-dependent enzyme [Streptomyces phaeolivaceus]